MEIEVDQFFITIFIHIFNITCSFTSGILSSHYSDINFFIKKYESTMFLILEIVLIIL